MRLSLPFNGWHFEMPDTPPDEDMYWTLWAFKESRVIAFLRSLGFVVKDLDQRIFVEEEERWWGVALPKEKYNEVIVYLKGLC